MVDGLKKFPAAWKLWVMLGQLEERSGNPAAARSAYAKGRGHCIHSVPLWTAAAALEEAAGNFGKARATLEQSRLKNPKNEELWLAAIRTEQRGGNTKARPEPPPPPPPCKALVRGFTWNLK